MKATEKDALPQKPAKKKPGRAPVSCAECRRLKMRCDRGNPCENCTKRGCAAICPNGTLTTGKHNRMILSNTEELHDKIESLLNRIRLLEDALQTLQASVSPEPHPLLTGRATDALPTIHVYPAGNQSVVHQPVTTRSDEEDDCLDSFGSLSIGSDGESIYLGQTARADYLLNDSDSEDELEVGRLPRSFYNFCWPECPPPDNSIEETVLSYLPDLNEAYKLSDTYSSMSSWLGFIIPSEAIREEIIAHVYHLPNRPWANTLPTCPHRLALLFAIFSLGALFDPSQKPSNVQSDDYYHLSRVALSLKSAVLETTVHAVLAIVHMACILLLRDSYNAHEQGWVMLGVANKLALGMGLHRDSSRWQLHEEASEGRHIAFWQLYLVETMASFHFGRPTLLSDRFIECPFPKHLNQSQGSDADQASAYLYWLLRFMRIARRTLSEISEVKATSYFAVLDIDSKIRNLPGVSLRHPAPNERHMSTIERIHWCVNRCKESMLLHIHRGFLIQALNDNPQNPSASKFGKSVQACFESSHRLIESVCWISEQCPQIATRMSALFGTSISAAVVMCIIATRFPASEVARSALEKLDYLHATLQNASAVNSTAKRNLGLTRRLRSLARTAVDRPRLSAHGALFSTEDDELLNRGCGKKCLRTRKDRDREAIRRPRHQDPPAASPSRLAHGTWSGQGAKAPVSSSYDVAGPSASDDYPRFGFSGDASNLPFGQGLDSSWNTFIQQLGF